MLLHPENDIDQELADHPTDVLISADINKSNRGFRLKGRETFRIVLITKKAQDGNVSLSPIECIWDGGKELGVSLQALGKVAEFAAKFRLEASRISMDSQSDRKPYRRIITEDVARFMK